MFLLFRLLSVSQGWTTTVYEHRRQERETLKGCPRRRGESANSYILTGTDFPIKYFWNLSSSSVEKPSKACVMFVWDAASFCSWNIVFRNIFYSFKIVLKDIKIITAVTHCVPEKMSSESETNWLYSTEKSLHLLNIVCIGAKFCADPDNVFFLSHHCYMVSVRASAERNIYALSDACVCVCVKAHFTITYKYVCV